MSHQQRTIVIAAISWSFGCFLYQCFPGNRNWSRACGDVWQTLTFAALLVWRITK